MGAEISLPLGFDPWTVQLVASFYMDYGTPAHIFRDIWSFIKATKCTLAFVTTVAQTLLQHVSAKSCCLQGVRAPSLKPAAVMNFLDSI
jgi:hypothetical protein